MYYIIYSQLQVNGMQGCLQNTDQQCTRLEDVFVSSISECFVINFQSISSTGSKFGTDTKTLLLITFVVLELSIYVSTNLVQRWELLLHLLRREKKSVFVPIDLEKIVFTAYRSCSCDVRDADSATSWRIGTC